MGDVHKFQNRRLTVPVVVKSPLAITDHGLLSLMKCDIFGW
jgi:hypothetical protein